MFAGMAFADVNAADDSPAIPSRPAIKFNRWQENWSALADPTLRTEPLDTLKYIRLSAEDPQSYASLGAGLRERFESSDASSFGVSHQQSAHYVIQRLEVHADIHANSSWQVFTQLEDDRAFRKAIVTPVDADLLDLEQAFVAFTTPISGGVIKARLGRQEIGFDLQRFVGARDGPNVRQAFDAAWLDWELAPWRLITFWSHPVQYLNGRPFDDHSNAHFQYGGLRVERQNVGPGALSIYYSRYDFDTAHFLFAAGRERRNILDARYAGIDGGYDWDLEGMGQSGSLGSKRIQAWAVGTIVGYSFAAVSGHPRLGLQMDAASGNRQPRENIVGTFNPLFPNGYYVTLSGYTGYSNLLHLKPSITFTPIRSLKVMNAVGMLWRATTADAVYTQPDVPVTNTAGQGGRWTAAYLQCRADYGITANLSGAVEINHYIIGDAIRRAGGHDSDYLSVELKFLW